METLLKYIARHALAITTDPVRSRDAQVKINAFNALWLKLDVIYHNTIYHAVYFATSSVASKGEIAPRNGYSPDVGQCWSWLFALMFLAAYLWFLFSSPGEDGDLVVLADRRPTLLDVHSELELIDEPAGAAEHEENEVETDSSDDNEVEQKPHPVAEDQDLPQDSYTVVDDGEVEKTLLPEPLQPVPEHGDLPLPATECSKAWPQHQGSQLSTDNEGEDLQSRAPKSISSAIDDSREPVEKELPREPLHAIAEDEAQDFQHARASRHVLPVIYESNLEDKALLSEFLPVPETPFLYDTLSVENETTTPTESAIDDTVPGGAPSATSVPRPLLPHNLPMTVARQLLERGVGEVASEQVLDVLHKWAKLPPRYPEGRWPAGKPCFEQENLSDDQGV